MSLPKMRAELQELEDARRRTEKEHEDANRQYKIGMWAILLGLPLLFLYGIGALFIIAGILAALTNGRKRRVAGSELARLNNAILTLRRRIADAETS